MSKFELITFSPALYGQMGQQVDKDASLVGNAANPLFAGPTSFAGIPISSSSLFPYEHSCPHCNGSGEGGSEATYCRQCKGAGKTIVDGMILQHGLTKLIVRPLPPKFAPSFPFAVPLRAIQKVAA